MLTSASPHTRAIGSSPSCLATVPCVPHKDTVSQLSAEVDRAQARKRHRENGISAWWTLYQRSRRRYRNYCRQGVHRGLRVTTYDHSHELLQNEINEFLLQAPKTKYPELDLVGRLL